MTKDNFIRLVRYSLNDNYCNGNINGKLLEVEAAVPPLLARGL